MGAYTSLYLVVLFLAARNVRGKLLRGAICTAMNEFILSRNCIKKIGCIRVMMDALSAPKRMQPKRGRRLTLNEVVELVHAVPL
ncbi:hypothetical protein L916_06959 [Phytophthora nicotianae]|uniref:Secreted protein n=1 Tax=Phytophthora nicotianae TaxID=4792 RepID=W2J9A5_PHYNI|nr:hypothetical protein L916_06959 [Phytophthora nicotianae]